MPKRCRLAAVLPLVPAAHLRRARDRQSPVSDQLMRLLFVWTGLVAIVQRSPEFPYQSPSLQPSRH
eukprot:6261287-Amphidinium_carterae.1